MVNLDPTSSLRQISLEVGLCKSRIQTILRKYKYHPYKAQCHQEIFAVDEESRSAFCYEMQERANNDRRFLSAICFTDECTFTLNNEPNVQNTRYWAQENPRVNISTRTQYPQKINIWAGIFNNNIIGPFEIEGRAGPIPILSIGYRPILQAFRYVPIPKNLQILLSEKYLNLIEQAASRKAPTLVFQENWLDNNLWTCYTYSGEDELKDLLKENYPLRYADDHERSPQQYQEFDSLDKTEEAGTITLFSVTKKLLLSKKKSDEHSTGTTSKNKNIDRDIENEISVYLHERTEPLESDPVEFWKKEIRFPHLKKLAAYYLAIPAGSVFSEQIFSETGCIFTSKRTSLTAEHVKQLIFLKKNWMILEK
jgi:hypothetical protein